MLSGFSSLLFLAGCG